MLTFTLAMALTCGWADDPEPKDPKVDIRKFTPTREPKKIPEDLRAPGPFDDDFPIPQDPKLGETLRAKRLEHAKSMYLKGMEQAKPAECKAMEAVAALHAGVYPNDSRLFDPVSDQMLELLKAECDHPLIIMQAFPYHGLRGEAERTYSEDYGAACDKVLKGPYHPAVRAREAFDAAVMLEDANSRGDKFPKKDYYGLFWKAFSEVCQLTDRHDQAEAMTLAKSVHDRYVALKLKRLDGWTAIKQALDDAKADPILVKLIEAEFRIAYALDIRETKASDADAKKLKKERLAQARQLLEEAHAQAPDREEIATKMISVCTLEEADREEMEKWFTFSMKANPDSLGACLAKLRYFSRPGDKNEKAMLIFGRQCVRVNNQPAFLGQVLYQAHLNLARSKPEGYFGKSEPWADVREVFETRLKAVPECRYSRSVYGLHCLNAGEGPGAFHNLLAVKAKPWEQAFRNRSFDSALSAARQLAKEQEGE